MVIGNPFPLKQNADKSFIGSYVLGMGFVLTTEQANELISKDPRNKEVIYPYLNGEDLNNDPEQKPSRWVINFLEWDEEKAKSYPDCYEILERLVKPERLTKNDQRGREKWWQFLRVRRELYETISQLDQVMILPRVSKYFLVSIGLKNIVYSEATVVLALDSFFEYGVLSSSLHEIWAWKNSSTMKGDALRYSASKAFETFPFPIHSPSPLEELGYKLNTLRRELTMRYKIGLTDLQNIYHKNNIKQSDIYYDEIITMRGLCREIDSLVLEAYGWSDIQLQHDFYEIEYLPENDRIRYTIHPIARKEILKRLSLLNHQLHNAELERKIEPKPKQDKRKSANRPKTIDLFPEE